MAEDRDSGVREGHSDCDNQRQMPLRTTALELLKELLKRESGGEELAPWLKFPLERAVYWGDWDLTAALVDAGADPAQADSEGVPILGLASREGDVGVISTIATRRPEALHQTDADSGYSALHHAAKKNQVNQTKALVRLAVATLRTV